MCGKSYYILLVLNTYLLFRELVIYFILQYGSMYLIEPIFFSFILL